MFIAFLNSPTHHPSKSRDGKTVLKEQKKKQRVDSKI